MNKNAIQHPVPVTNNVRRAHDNKPVQRLDLDRRLIQRERRTSEDFTYKGLPRRYTIDRRLVLGDRRGEK